MKFPEEFFYDEVREGFYVSSTMKRVWAAQLEVLAQIDQVCQRHHIPWFADCGTLLGAVRHGGYIPWDDDLDICMLRDDFTRFLAIASEELPEGYWVRTYGEDRWELTAQVANRRTLSIESAELQKYHGCPYAVSVDVFVLDYLAPDENEEEVRRNLLSSVLTVAGIENLDGGDLPEEAIECIAFAEEYCRVKIDRQQPLRRQLFQLAERLASLYNSTEAQHVALMSFWTTEHNHKYPIHFVDHITQLPFENIMINVPANYDGVLRIEYGDYLYIRRDGGLHNYPYFSNQENTLTGLINNPDYYRYQYKGQDLAQERETAPPRLKKRTRQFCVILHRLHDMLRQIGNGMDQDQIFNLMEQCQEGLICLGEEIEAKEGEGFITVKYMESYCEEMYLLTEKLVSEESSIANELDELDAILVQMEESIEKDLPDKKEILFLTFRADYWDALEPYYQKEIRNPENDVIVMPIPFFDKDILCNAGKMHFDVEQYPKGLPIVNFRHYDIKAHHPSVIYTQNAYDDYNETYSLLTTFFASELRKYTEKLIYIPYFHLGVFDPADEKFRQSTRYFVKIPGVICADEVIVESEEIRKLYIEELAEFAGVETKQIWEKKIVVEEEGMRMCSDTVEEKTEIPEDWEKILVKDNGKKKKTVLYLTTVSTMYQYQEMMLDKLRRVLEIFREQQDEVALIWHPHPAIDSAMHLFERPLWLAYRDIVDEYRSEGWGILDESPDAALAIELADAYYGDSDVILQKCRRKGLPVMVQDVTI